MLATEIERAVEARPPAARMRLELFSAPFTPVFELVSVRFSDPAKPPKLVRVTVDRAEDPT